MANLFSTLFGLRKPALGAADEALLTTLRRPGALLEVGGRPKPHTRETSWWGGNFIAEPPRAGLVPLVQLRADELPAEPRALVEADYLLIWIEANPARRGGPDCGLEVQRLGAPHSARLAPVETMCRLDGSLACLPLSPAPRHDGSFLPHPGDAPEGLPLAPQRAPEDEEPVTLGGWPAWIGPSQWPEGARFVLEIRSSEKGRLHLPDEGSLYLFDRPDGSWRVRRDGF